MMEYGICTLAVVAVRENPSDKSPLTSQLLFGESVIIEDGFKNWFYVKSLTDGHSGWVNALQLTAFDKESHEQFESLTKPRLINRTTTLVNDNNESMVIVAGSVVTDQTIPTLNDYFRWHPQEKVDTTTKKHDVDFLLKTAKIYLNAPSLQGGRTPFGIDSSGFTQMVFLLGGYHLPRDCAHQLKIGEPVYLLEEARSGDLVFFGEEDAPVSHVGILTGNRHIIHVSGFVKTDIIDHFGIFDEKNRRYTHRLKAIQRIL